MRFALAFLCCVLFAGAAEARHHRHHHARPACPSGCPGGQCQPKAAHPPINAAPPPAPAPKMPVPKK